MTCHSLGPSCACYDVLLFLLLQFGAVEPPRLFFSGEELELKSLLGTGGTATAYQSTVQLHGKEQPVAVKLLHDGGSSRAAHEVAILQHLQGCNGIVRLVGPLDDGAGLVLQPVGKSLAALKEALDSPTLFECMPALLDAVREVHDRGVVHRDLRSCNLLMAEDKATRRSELLIMDW